MSDGIEINSPRDVLRPDVPNIVIPAVHQCVLCEETILAGEDVRQMNDAQQAHRECLLRSVIGGIGHLEDHNHWCNEVGDPDGGRTYRQSAIEVEQWVHEHGIDEATRI